jgi:hypothetical protein
MARFALVLAGALLGVWLLGAMLQGLFLRLSVTSHKLWLFQFWFEKFAWGLVAGFLLGFVACFSLVRRRAR